MSSAPNLTLISEVTPLMRRDFTLTDTTLLNPVAANPLVDGEWLEMDSASYTVKRGTGEAASNSWPVFSLRGQYDTQAIGKACLLYAGAFEAETSIVNTTSIVVGSFLVVADVTIGGLTKRGLKLAAGAGQHMVVGVCTKLPGGGKIRFLHRGIFQITI
jgi:hypothetical protein